jgi:hypothetical protein
MRLQSRIDRRPEFLDCLWPLRHPSLPCAFGEQPWVGAYCGVGGTGRPVGPLEGARGLF